MLHTERYVSQTMLSLNTHHVKHKTLLPPPFTFKPTLCDCVTHTAVQKVSRDELTYTKYDPAWMAVVRTVRRPHGPERRE